MRNKGVKGLTVDCYRSSYSRIIQFHRVHISDSWEVILHHLTIFVVYKIAVWLLTCLSHCVIVGNL